MTLFSTEVAHHEACACSECRLPPFQPHSITSYDAAREIVPTSDNLRESVYRCIVEFGPLTDETIADTLALNPSTARPRRIELKDAGRIVQRGVLANRSGRMAAAWVVA